MPHQVYLTNSFFLFLDFKEANSSNENKDAVYIGN